MSEVSLVNIRKRFGQSVRAVNDLDLEIRAGEFVVLLGPSGCGKTTTLRCVAGLEEPDEGRITIGGQPVTDAGRGLFVAPEKRHVGMVFQSYALWPHLTVAENVGYPLKFRGRAGQDAGQAIAAALAVVGLKGYEDRYAAQLSGGQQQRVALARALVGQPRLLLFDEPLSNLDAQLRARLRQDLRRIHQESGFTAIYVTHDQTEALALADRVVVMDQGRIVQIGPPSEIFLSPNSRFVAEFVGFDNLIPGRLVASAERGAIAVDGWPVVAGRTPHGFVEGDGGYFAARSTALNARPAEDDAPADALRGRIRSSSYLGDRYQADIDIGGHTVLATLTLAAWGRDPSRQAQWLGRVVDIPLNPEEVVLVPAEGASVEDRTLIAGIGR